MGIKWGYAHFHFLPSANTPGRSSLKDTLVLDFPASREKIQYFINDAISSTILYITKQTDYALALQPAYLMVTSKSK